MITSFEVGAVFTIEDAAGAVLTRLAEQATALSESIVAAEAAVQSFVGTIAELSRATEGVTAVSESFLQAGIAAEEAGSAMRQTLTSVTSETEVAITGVDLLANAYKDAAVAAREMGVASASAVSKASGGSAEASMVTAAGAGGIGGRGRRGRGGHGGGGVVGGIAHLLPAAAVYDAMEHALDMDTSLRLTTQAFGIDPNSPDGAKVMADLQRSATEASRGTQFSEAQVSSGMAAFARPLGLRGMEGAEKFEQLFPRIAQAAETIKLQKGGGDYADILSSTVQMAHMTGIYDPQQMEGVMNQLYQVSRQIPGATFPEEAHSMSYLMAFARTAGVPVQKAINLGGFLQQVGLEGSTGPATAQQMLIGTLRGPMGDAHARAQGHGHHEDTLRKEEREFMSAYRLQDQGARGHHREALEKRQSMHEEAMRLVGLHDAQGKPTFLDPQGNVDVDKIVGTFVEYTKHHSKFEGAQAGYNLWGVRGQRAAESIANDPSRWDTFQQNVLSGKPLADMRKESVQSPQGEFLQTWARLQDILKDLGTSVLPAFSSVLKDAVIPALTTIGNFVKNPENSGIVQTAAVGGGAVAVSALAGKGLRVLKGGPRVLPRSLPTLAESGLAGAEAATAGDAVGGAGALSAMGGLSMAEMAGVAVPLASAIVGSIGFAQLMAQHVSQLANIDAYKRQQAGHDTYADVISHGPVGRGPGGLTTQNYRPSTSAQQAQAIDVHIGPITLNGVADQVGTMVHDLFEKMTREMARALARTATDTGAGTMSSPALSGGGFP